MSTLTTEELINFITTHAYPGAHGAINELLYRTRANALHEAADHIDNDDDDDCDCGGCDTCIPRQFARELRAKAEEI